MSFRGMLEQGEDQRCFRNGGGRHGNYRLMLAEENFVQDVDGGALGSGEVGLGGGGGGGGGGAGSYRREFAAPLAINTSGSNGYGADLALFSPSDLLSPSLRQPLQRVSSPFNWHSLLSGQPSATWQPDTPLSGFAVIGSCEAGTDSLSAYALAEDGVKRSDDIQDDVCLAHECSVISDGVISEAEVDHSSEVKEEWTNNLSHEKDTWRNFGDFMLGDVKLEESENTQEAGHMLGDVVKSRKRSKHSRLHGHVPEVIVNFESSGSSSDSDSDSEVVRKRKKESQTRKQKKPGEDADGNVTWIDESVRFLFETYDAIHQRLWEENKGQVKYQKKWTPILKAMKARFGNHFTKKQCQSKYWSVRRECTEYRIMSVKAAATNPLWNPSIAGRELLKPKFYDVWLEVSGQYHTILPTTKNSIVTGEGCPGELITGVATRVLGRDGQPVKERVKDSRSVMTEMQRLMLLQLQASEKREETMKYRAEMMMGLLTQHIEHVEDRVSKIQKTRTPQIDLLEQVNLKLEKVLEGFTTLNQHLALLL